jgi:tryptophan-rich sensory protein
LSRNLLVALAAFAVLTFSAAGIGSAFTARSVRTWYPTLRKPPGNPPASYFGSVWTVLYCLMTLAAWNVWRIGDGWSGATPAITIFLIQLALNAVWSAIFFGLRSPRLALAEIILLWAAILASTISFWRISPFSGALLVPYLAWITYATYLNAGIWHLNRAHSDSSPQFPPGPRGNG